MVKNVNWYNNWKSDIVNDEIFVFYGDYNLFLMKDNKPDIIKISHFYLKKILSEFLKKNIKENDFYKNQYYKPYLRNSEIYFNLSHSKNAFIISLSNFESGIDIEEIQTEINFRDCMNYAFSEEELSYCKTNNYNNFFEIWTQKEAYLKAIGIGLTDNLKEINCLDNDIYKNLGMKYISFYSPNQEICSMVYNNNIKHLQFIKIA